MKKSLKTVISSLAALSLVGVVLPALASGGVSLKDASSPNSALNAAVMTVSFPVPSNAVGPVGYSILATGDGVASQRGSTAVCDTSNCTSYLTGLTGGTNYTVEVRWINSAGTSTVIGTSTKNAVSIPGAPTAISATSTGTSVALAWALPSNSGGLPITACLISGGPSVVSVLGGTSSKTIDNLSPGLQYAMSISCKNDNGTSATSSFTAFTVKTAPTAPAKPTATRAGESLSVGWVAPASNGADIAGYSVYLVDAAGTDVGNATAATAGSTSAVVSLASVADGTYTVQVLATNAIGSSARSPKSNSFTIGTVATPTPTPSASSSASPSASANPSSTPSASPSVSVGGGGGGGGGGPLPTPTATPTPSAPPVVISPKPSPTPTKTTVPPVTPVVTVKAVPGLAAGSTKITATAQAALNSQAKSLIAGKAKQVTVAISTKSTTLVKAKAQAAAVAKALAKAGVTATVKVTGTGAKTVVTVVATKKKK